MHVNHTKIVYTALGIVMAVVGSSIAYELDWQRDQDLIVAELSGDLKAYEELLKKQKENLELQLKIIKLEQDKKEQSEQPQWYPPPQQYRNYGNWQ